MARIRLFAPTAFIFLSAAVAAGATVTGVVSSADTHVVLGSMVVAAYDGGGVLQGSATTDSTGHYILQLPNGSYRLLAYDPKGLFATTFDEDADSFDTAPVVAIDDRTTVRNFGLRIGGRITGSVFVANDGPMAQATVAAYNRSGTRRGFALTDSGGRYSIVLPPGQYKIVAYDDAGFFAPRFYPDQYGLDRALPLSVAAGGVNSGRDVYLEIAAHLSGAVTDFGTGANLAGMTIYAYDDAGGNIGRATTNGDGRYVMNLPAGSYRVLATDPNLIYATGFFGDTGSFEDSLAVSVVPSQTRSDVDFQLHRGGPVTGRVVGSEAIPLQNVTVAAYNGDGSKRTATHTDDSGRYKLVLPADDFRFAAYDEQLKYATQFYRLRDTFRGADGVTVVPPGAVGSIDFGLIHAGRVSGTITEAGTGNAAFAVTVAAYDASGEAANVATSNVTGAYTLVVPPGNYRIVAYDSALRYATAYGGGASTYEQATVYDVASDQTQNLSFSMTRGVRLGGTVTDFAHHPLSGIEIGVLDGEGNRVATTVVTSGGFSLVLLPGSYRFAAIDPGGHYSTLYYSQAASLADATPLVVQAGTSPPTLTFVLSPVGRRRPVAH